MVLWPFYLNMGVPIPGKDGLYIETVPRVIDPEYDPVQNSFIHFNFLNGMRKFIIITDTQKFDPEIETWAISFEFRV